MEASVETLFMKMPQTPRESNGDERLDGRDMPNDYFGSSTSGTPAQVNANRNHASSSSTSPQPPQRQTTQPTQSQHPWSTLFGEQSMPTTHQSSTPHLHLQKKLGMRRVQSGGSASSGHSGSSATTIEDLHKFQAIDSAELVRHLLESPSSTLVIDIRPSTSFSLSRVRDSVNVCAPSTLLRRNGVTIERIEEEMLTSEEDQRRFSAWRFSQKTARVVVLDTDTQDMTSTGRPSAGGGGPCLAGLLRKFDLAGYDGALCWLVGGFEAFAQHVKQRKNDAHVLDSTVTQTDASVKRRASVPNNGDLRLPALSGMRTKSLVQPLGLPMEAFASSSTALDASATHGKDSRQKSAANPFFDNIRQNRELRNGITERIPLSVPDMTESEARRLPGCLAKLRGMSESERADCLAQAFYDVERDERDRLMDTMQRHADESDGSRKHLLSQSQQLSSKYCAVSPGEDGHTADKANFPFSIAAALERGGENRYNNIWTYEHSRVLCPKRADYLNGSYIEPARKYGCRRRYIATQAPLPSTFDTFWSVVWQQNVHTICMVTREFESGRVQSHNYWKSKQYGSLQLEMIEEVALDRNGDVLRSLATDDDDTQCGFDFGGSSKEEDYATVQRRFWLSDESGKRRAITQFQFIAWPDYSVPDNAEDLLVFMRLASHAQHTAELELSKTPASTTVGPMVVHCSAGVGRTGTYILIDAALDVFRRARWAQAGRSELDVWDEGFAYDGDADRARKFLLTTSSQQHRKNLKRELSPVVRSTSPSQDAEFAREGSESGERSVDSPPPTRRSRPDENSEHDGKALSSSPAESGSMSHLPFSAMGPDGPQTPSTALGRLSLSSAQSGTPSRSRHGSSQNGKSENETLRHGKREDSISAERIQAEVMDVQGNDLIRTILQTIREQRMSMVQTSRQFVFAYWTILNGVVHEMRREEASFGRRR